MPIPHFDAETIVRSTPWETLIPALRAAFVAPHSAPDRHIHEILVLGARAGTALLMPAWIEGESYGVKLANIFPSNGERGLPSVHSLYILFDGTTGAPTATMDGSAITVRRTAATSALASSILSRPDSETLLVLGAGRMTPLLIDAHRFVRPIKEVLIWARDSSRADSLATKVGGIAVTDLDAAIARADIISAATLSREPLIKGELLRPGIHLDLVGAFSPAMRETDAEAVAKSSVFIDTLGGAKAEAGDLIQAMSEGRFEWENVRSDLTGLCDGRHAGRSSPQEITMFKSVGAAIEDLAAARLVLSTST